MFHSHPSVFLNQMDTERQVFMSTPKLNKDQFKQWQVLDIEHDVFPQQSLEQNVLLTTVNQI